MNQFLIKNDIGQIKVELIRMCAHMCLNTYKKIHTYIYNIDCEKNLNNIN